MIFRSEDIYKSFWEFHVSKIEYLKYLMKMVFLLLNNIDFKKRIRQWKKKTYNHLIKIYTKSTDFYSLKMFKMMLYIEQIQDFRIYNFQLIKYVIFEKGFFVIYFSVKTIGRWLQENNILILFICDSLF
jgi:hypothetical protein